MLKKKWRPQRRRRRILPYSEMNILKFDFLALVELMIGILGIIIPIISNLKPTWILLSMIMSITLVIGTLFLLIVSILIRVDLYREHEKGFSKIQVESDSTGFMVFRITTISSIAIIILNVIVMLLS